nr:hypothetical protein [Tanacetum cinerariifolium]
MTEEPDKDESAKVVNEEEETEEVRVNAADAQVKGRQADIYHINMDHAAKVLSMQEEEEPEVVTTAKLTIEVVAAASGTVSVATVVPAPVTAATEESSTNTPAETNSKDKGNGILVEEPKPMKKKKQVEMDEAFARKLQEEFNQEIDWEVAMEHVKQSAKESPYVQRYQVMKKRPVTEAQARRNMMVYLKNTAGYRLNYFKEMSYGDIRLIFKAKFNSNLNFLLKTKERIEEEESRAIEIINETPAQKAPKRRRLNKEAEDVEELKHHLEIVPDEDDDVFTEATLLARKVPVVDYQIMHIDKKPRYKIIRADDTHQPDGQDNVWRNQSTIHGQALVKSWKLLTSCGVHIISFNTTQIILLVERRYPLMNFTLEQMLNVIRLQVEEQSEMSLELIRFTSFGVDAAIKLKEKNSKCLLLPVKILVLPDKIDAAGYYCWIAPPSPDYVSGPEYPPSPEFVPKSVYREFMPAEDDILPAEEQPLPAAASPTTESDPNEDLEDDPEEDPEDDPKEDLADYPADGGDEGDDEDESSDDDEDDVIDIEGDEEGMSI